MKKLALMIVATAFTSAGGAFAPAYAHDCSFDKEPPTIPDGAGVSDDEHAAVVQSIRDFQGELGVYRACLEAVIEDAALEDAERQAALDDYNASVDVETKLVEAYQAMRAKIDG